MIATITNHVSKGLQNHDTPANKSTAFKTNFNMPIPELFDSTYVDPDMRYKGNADFLTETTSYDLTGFSPGYEICFGLSVWDWENNSGSTYNINTQLYQRWTEPTVQTDPASTIYRGVWGDTFTDSLPAYYYTTIWYATGIGCAPWEITTSDTYHFRANSTGTPAISVVDTGVAFSNVPSTTQLGTDKKGYIWVEGNNLCYVNANRWKHTMVGNDQGDASADPGYFWLDTSNNLSWIGDDGHKYTAKWKKKQFADTFSGGASGSTYAGTSKVGYMWVDSEFGLTHLAYIASDGYKYLTGAGDDPYA